MKKLLVLTMVLAVSSTAMGQMNGEIPQGSVTVDGDDERPGTPPGSSVNAVGCPGSDGDGGRRHTVDFV